MPNRDLRICLLGVTFKTRNLGVGALTAGTLRCIFHRFPQAKIFFLDYGKQSPDCSFESEGRRIPIQTVLMRFSVKFYLANNIVLLILMSLGLKLVPFAKLRRKLIAKNDCLRCIHQADMIGSMAGGDSFSDIYGLGRFLYVSLPQLLVLLMGKKLLLLPQTLGPFEGLLAKRIARYILKRAEVIYSRDQAGLTSARALVGGNHKAEKLRFCYDVGFVVDSVVPAHMDLSGLPVKQAQDSCIVGLNVSGLLFMGGYSRNNMFGLKTDYRELVYQIIELLIGEKNAVVMLVPHVFGGTEHPESDSVVCEKIYEALKAKYRRNLYFVRGNYDQSEIKHIIGLNEFFIGSRMHACIAALSQCIPAVAIAYSDKFAGVMRTVGMESFVADLRRLGKNEILTAVGLAYEQRGLVRRQLEHKMPEVKETVLDLFRCVDLPLATSDVSHSGGLSGVR